MSISPDLLAELVTLRRTLHAHPEVSGAEAETAERIRAFLTRYQPDLLHTGVGGHGVCAVFDSGKLGPTVAIRCELDAVPVDEANDVAHRSVRKGVAHKCGHDGHMATVAGLAALIRQRGLPAGKVALIFQPAEESGAGARAMLEDPRFLALKPDQFFALHNLPRQPLHVVLVRDEVFASASTGLIVRFTGSTTHSSYPEHGRSPALAIAALIESLTGLAKNNSDPDELALVTVTQAQLGDMTTKIDFGVAPATGCVMAVLRTSRQERLDGLKRAAVAVAEAAAREHDLECEITWHEEFASTTNRPASVGLVRRAAQRAGLRTEELSAPFRWSEDFGLFLQHYPGALFGIGAGESQPQLHNEHYDYPEELIPTGLAIYWALIEDVLAPPL